MSLLDKAIIGKETRTVSKLTKYVRKFRNVIQAHHVLAIAEFVNEVDLQKNLLKRSKNFNESFAEKFEINKATLARISKTLELEIFLRLFVVQLLWREEKYEDCLVLVNSLI